MFRRIRVDSGAGNDLKVGAHARRETEEKLLIIIIIIIIIILN